MTTVDSTVNNPPVDAKRDNVVAWTFDSRPVATDDSTAPKPSHQQKTQLKDTGPQSQVATDSSAALPILRALKSSIEKGIPIKHNDGTQFTSQLESQTRDDSHHSQNGFRTNGAAHDDKQTNKETNESRPHGREPRDSKEAEQTKRDPPSRHDSGYDALHTNGDRSGRDNGRPPLRGASHYSPPRSDSGSRRRSSNDGGRDLSRDNRFVLREADTYRPGADTYRPTADTYRSGTDTYRSGHRSLNNQTEAGNASSSSDRLPYLSGGGNQGHNDTSRTSRPADYRGQSVPPQEYRRFSLDQARGTRYSPYPSQLSHRGHDSVTNGYPSSTSRDRSYESSSHRLSSTPRDQSLAASVPLPPRASSDYRGYERSNEYRKQTEIDHTRYHDAYATQRDYRERDYYATARPQTPLYDYIRRPEDPRYQDRYPTAAPVPPTAYHERSADPYVADQGRGYPLPERRVDPAYDRRDYPPDYTREASDRYDSRGYSGTWNPHPGEHRRDYRDAPPQTPSTYPDRRYSYGSYDTRAPPPPVAPAGYDERYQARYEYR